MSGGDEHYFSHTISINDRIVIYHWIKNQFHSLLFSFFSSSSFTVVAAAVKMLFSLYFSAGAGAAA